MKKLGFGRKKEDSGSGRDALFATKSGPPPANNNANPYAVNNAGSDPYLSQNNNSGPPPPYNGGGPGGPGGFRNEKSGVPPGGYNNGPSFGSRPNDNRFSGPGQEQRDPQDNRFSQQDRFGGPSPQPGGNRFGAPPGNSGAYGNSGFGENRYGDNGQQGGNAPSRYGAGGYGGFGESNNPGNSAAREDLFSGAKPPSSMAPAGDPGASGNSWDNGGRGAGYGSSNAGAYQDRQLTAEEQEEEDIQASKQEIRFLKQQDVASTRNALRIAAQAEETGRQTLERLGAQGESIHNTERNLDLSSSQNKLAAEKARELKTLNRSMFAVHVSNPFTSGKRIAERERKVLDDASRDRQERENIRNANWSNASRQHEYGKELNKSGVQKTNKANLAERSKYQFEADSEDEQMEDEIDQNLNALHGAAKRMNVLAGAMGREVDIQNQHLDRIGGKVDKVDDEIALNRSRLDRIK